MKMENLKINDLVQVKYKGREVTGFIKDFEDGCSKVTLSHSISILYKPEEIIKVWR